MGRLKCLHYDNTIYVCSMREPSWSPYFKPLTYLALLRSIFRMLIILKIYSTTSLHSRNLPLHSSFSTRVELAVQRLLLGQVIDCSKTQRDVHLTGSLVILKVYWAACLSMS